MNDCKIEEMMSLQRVSVFLKTDVLRRLLGPGKDDFFGFGYEL